MTRPPFTVHLSLITALVSACTPMPHKPVIGPDIANYTLTEHRVGCWEMTTRCLPEVPVPFKPLLITPLGCAEIDFEHRTCDIYTCWWTPGFIVEHERLHCLGMDHGGTLQRAWDAWVDGQLLTNRTPQ